MGREGRCVELGPIVDLLRLLHRLCILLCQIRELLLVVAARLELLHHFPLQVAVPLLARLPDQAREIRARGSPDTSVNAPPLAVSFEVPPRESRGAAVENLCALTQRLLVPPLRDLDLLRTNISSYSAAPWEERTVSPDWRILSNSEAVTLERRFRLRSSELRAATRFELSAGGIRARPAANGLGAGSQSRLREAAPQKLRGGSLSCTSSCSCTLTQKTLAARTVSS